MLLKKSVWRPVPYQNRSDLTDREIRGIDHYKDLVNPQYQWDYRRRCNAEEISLGIDCFMVNQVLRGIIPVSVLSKRDLIRYNAIVLQLNAAIKKSRIDSSIDVVKGVSYFDGLEDYQIDNVVTDNAFGSFTTSIEKAAEYANTNADNELIFFYLRLEKGDSALYIDADEEEWLLGSDRKYIVGDIIHYEPSQWIRGKQAIVYYLERIKR